MFILTDGNRIQIGFEFLKVNILIMLWLVPLPNKEKRIPDDWWYKLFLTFENISYVCYDAGGEHLLYISVITYFL